jgi:hypothetical protein
MPQVPPLTVVPAAVVTVRSVPKLLYARMPKLPVPVTLPFAVMVSAPVPKLRAAMPLAPLTVVPAAVVTLRAVLLTLAFRA